jgi:hypothetical protein
MLKLTPGTHHRVEGRGVYLVLLGSGECEGKPLRQYTSVYLDQDEAATLQAAETMTLLHYGLPDLAGLAASGNI